MGKTRDFFKKIAEMKGTSHAKMGTIKDRNHMDLTEEIQKKWQEYTGKVYKKVLMTWISMMMWSLTQSQTSQNVKSNGPQETLL